MLIRIAEMTIEIKNRYDYLPWLCQGYIVEDGEPLFSVEASEAAIDEDIKRLEENGEEPMTRGYLEGVEVYRELCIKALEHGAMFLHSACIAVDGEAYCFTADSGTGKSTHIGLWMKLFGDRAVIVNGDKPLLRKKDGVFHVYGTPWCGKEGWSTNMGAPIKALCLVTRSETNFIEPMDGFNVIFAIIRQTLHPRTEEEFDIIMDLMDGLLSSVPMYRLGCNISLEAAKVAYEGMSGKKLDE
ncbi:MAG: hypothetical protein J1F63_05030 [Oscillospiraceae bacterium]|nr:hypothetical protein [Oscillospiraceae bacterium]